MKLADEIGAQDPEMAMFTIDAFLPDPRSPPPILVIIPPFFGGEQRSSGSVIDQIGSFVVNRKN